MARAEIEWWSGGIRVWDDDEAEYGDPYQYSPSLVRVDHRIYEVMLADKAPTPSQWRAIVEVVKHEAIDLLTWKRMRHNHAIDVHTLKIT